MQSLSEIKASENNQASNLAAMNINEALKGNLKESSYSIFTELTKDNKSGVSALTDFSLIVFDTETLKPISHIKEAHKKRINSVCIGDQYSYSCSNDGSAKVWDFKSKNPLVKTYRGNSNKELFSVSQSKHILASGSVGEIYFWDTRSGNLLTNFDETHQEDVSSVQFFKNKPSVLLSASIDGMVCLFDLNKDNEEEAAESVIVLQQAVNTCRFFQEDFSAAYALTTANTICILSLADAKVVKDINIIDNYETNEFALIDGYTKPNDPRFYYLKGNLEQFDVLLINTRGLIEEREVYLTEGENSILSNKYYTGHTGPITTAKKITDEHLFSTGEDGTFRITTKTTGPSCFDFEEMAQELFSNSNSEQSQNGSQQLFKPEGQKS